MMAPLLLPASVTARGDDPVTISVSVPAVVAAKKSFRVRFRVSVEPGALSIANGDVRLRARLEPECGGSYAGTVGPVVADQVLPPPPASYVVFHKGSARLKPFGPQTVCAFVEDADGRQYATSTEVTVIVSKPCTKATRKLARLRRVLKHATGSRRHRLVRRRRGAIAHQRRACRAGTFSTTPA